MRIAAIDIGTNSIHLLVSDVLADGRVQQVEAARSQVMLGSGGIGEHRIADDAFERGVEALEGFRAACDSLRVEEIVATATSAVREAENGSDFCRAVRERTGIHVRVISGVDEARLIYLGARFDLDLSQGPVLLFDVGGGSTEFIVATGDGPIHTASLHLGHIRLTDRFRHTDPLSAEDRQLMKRHIRAELSALVRRLEGVNIGSVVGTSGTVRCLARMAAAATGVEPDHEHGLVLTRRDVERILDRLMDTPSEDLSRIAGMDMRRKDTLTSGAILVREVLRAFNQPQLITSERSLRDGLVVDWMMHHRPELDLSRDHEPRERSVLLTMQRFGVDVPHAHQVARLALAIFDGTARQHGLAASDRNLLRDAALLHDIGHHIAGEGHPRHGQYLLKHIRLYGFTAPEVTVLSSLVRYHARGRPRRKHRDFAALPKADRQRVRMLAGMLQLADGLDRSHNQPIGRLDVTTHSGRVRLHARTRDGGELEQWEASQRTRLLADSLHIPVEVHVDAERPDGVATGPA